jgi:hypothetical protein
MFYIFPCVTIAPSSDRQINDECERLMRDTHDGMG